mgnify:CR=1 FL=1
MRKVLIFHADRCTGCKMCELVCSITNHSEFNPKKSHIRIMRNMETDVNIPILDVACDGSCTKCVEYCLPGALEFVSIEEAAVMRKQHKMGSFPVPTCRM